MTLYYSSLSYGCMWARVCSLCTTFMLGHENWPKEEMSGQYTEIGQWPAVILWSTKCPLFGGSTVYRIAPNFRGSKFS